MKKIFQSILFVSMALIGSNADGQTKPKKPVNSFEGADKALLMKTPGSTTTNQVAGNDQRRAKPAANKGKAGNQVKREGTVRQKPKPRLAKGS